jgi:hypothetical protein
VAKKRGDEAQSAVQLLPPLYLTIAVDRQTGLISATNSAQQSQQLGDCRLLMGAVEQVLRALQERRVELEVAAAVTEREIVPIE